MAKANKIDKEIGQRIEIYRKIRRKGRKILGDHLGCSYQQIQNYETGKHRVAASTLILISEFLEVPILNFFPKEDEKILEKSFV